MSSDPIADVEAMLAERGFDLSDHPEVAVEIWKTEPLLERAGIPLSVIAPLMQFVADMD
jgi:hypothetical protein